ncbi:probable E3 ubiquitin-protein ligase XERICO isoform X2 [Hibiscus syriacus]|uniref:probable E3 ubiquitin-protein ligase XERICO isoform X2 n=1 Tax=Hibiscus syriacus TaxID=106335 RepID=UPI001921AE84|nr:probable E3 ubiquitin-protein ligase XERICO isoform X2 [Hibiscus syriacus]
MLLKSPPLFLSLLFLSKFPMSFFVEDPGLIVTHLLYKTAVVLAVLRWVLSWLLSSDSQDNSSSSSSSVSSQMIRDSLALTNFEDAKERMPWVSDTCAVCLSQLKEGDEVRELRNCCHVFHRDCIDRWVDYDEDQDHDHVQEDDDNHKTCPLCRAPLLTSSQCLVWPKNEPSWAVERLLYLFGDDLLP